MTERKAAAATIDMAASSFDRAAASLCVAASKGLLNRRTPWSWSLFSFLSLNIGHGLLVGCVTCCLCLCVLSVLTYSQPPVLGADTLPPLLRR